MSKPAAESLGRVVTTWPVPGHVDGLRIDPATHRVWVTANEGANPTLNIIDPATGQVTPYTLAKTAPGGGYDDLAFLNGVTYIACSNPTLDGCGNNDHGRDHPDRHRFRKADRHDVRRRLGLYGIAHPVRSTALA